MITPCKQVMDTGKEMLWKVVGSTTQVGVGEVGTPSKYNPTASMPSMQRKPSRTKVTYRGEEKGDFSKVSPEPSPAFLSVAPSQSLQRRQHRGGFQWQDPEKGFILSLQFLSRRFYIWPVALSLPLSVFLPQTERINLVKLKLAPSQSLTWGFQIQKTSLKQDENSPWGSQMRKKFSEQNLFHLDSLWYEDANARSHRGYEGKCGEVDDAGE